MIRRETRLRVNAGANISKEDAEKMGMEIGRKIIYRRKTVDKPGRPGRIVQRKGVVWGMWKHHFVVLWDAHKYKEALQYRLLSKGSLHNCGEGVEIK